MASNQKNEGWSDEELSAAVDAYLYMLQLELSSIPFSPSRHSEILLSGPLHQRNDASVRYRMRNISCVMDERGAPTLTAFSIAPQVGRNIKRRINNILDERAGTLMRISNLQVRRSDSANLSDVLDQLRELKDRLTALENFREVGIGHNSPPDTIDLDEEDISEVSAAISDIEEEIVQSGPNKNRIRKLSEKISFLGLKIAVWIGQRLTDFAKAGAVAAGTSWGLSVSGVGEQILSALRTLFQFLG